MQAFFYFYTINMCSLKNTNSKKCRENFSPHISMLNISSLSVSLHFKIRSSIPSETVTTKSHNGSFPPLCKAQTWHTHFQVLWQ